MKERPIIFSGAMVRAILDGKKTETRRVVKPQPGHCDAIKQDGEQFRSVLWGVDAAHYGKAFFCPYGAPGDRLWVRETWCEAWFRAEDGWQTFYRADNPDGFGSNIVDLKTGNAVPAIWRPSIHMPRRASRLTLEICSVRVERLQDISEEDAIAEGAEQVKYRIGNDSMQCRARTHFRYLWDEINEKRAGCAWDDNPWVWAIEFRRVQS